MDMVIHAFNLSIRETEAGGPLWIPGQSSLHSEFQASQSYIAKPYLKKKCIGFYQNLMLTASTKLWHFRGLFPTIYG